MSMNYCVVDLLNTQSLKCISKVLGGSQGLNKSVSWVHILEIRDVVNDCVNGNEMILTTGIGFTSKEVAVGFMMELINCGVSALCIETALYYHTIDQELIDIADQNNFPLIEITSISRFVDITRELNTLIIGKNTNDYQNADFYDGRLNLFKNNGSIADGIRYTAEYLGIDIIYMPIVGEHYGVTSELKRYMITNFAEMENKFMLNEIYCKNNIAIKQIRIYGQNWGHLLFRNRKNIISEFELLILNRLSHKIQSETLDNLLKREEDAYKSKQWILRWMNGEIKEKEIREKLNELGFSANYKRFVICCMIINESDSEKGIEAGVYEDSSNLNRLFFSSLLHANLIMKIIFNNKGCSLLDFRDNNIMYYIILFTNAESDILHLSNEITEQLYSLVTIPENDKRITFFVGKSVDKFGDLHLSYKTIIEMLQYFKYNSEKVVIYEKLYLKRLIIRMADDPVLEDFILEHLGILIQPENLELLNTLKAYFECNMSKHAASEKLYIARQTLYFRLNKISEILGGDFCEGERKAAIAFALNAHDYLKANQRI